MNLEEIKKQRFLFLKKAYEVTKGDPSYMFSMFELGKELEFDSDLSKRIAQYLINEGLLEARALGGTIGISHAGVLEVEEALSNPNKPTDHFLPVNIINVQSMNNSVIQQGSSHSSQTVNITSKNINDLKNFISELKGSIDKLQLESVKHSELLSEIATLEAQSNSPRPKVSIIGETLVTIRSILEGVAGNIATPLFQTVLPQLIAAYTGS
ncbi:MAG: hypothetical protein Q7W45_03780 [Bacteroidota bacterium]|nr:hypothetical protein [Bacteroidota bacterium]MDP3144565.1 hypothetical protein [Bacteroidota bacterium]